MARPFLTNYTQIMAIKSDPQPLWSIRVFKIKKCFCVHLVLQPFWTIKYRVKFCPLDRPARQRTDKRQEEALRNHTSRCNVALQCMRSSYILSDDRLAAFSDALEHCTLVPWEKARAGLLEGDTIILICNFVFQSLGEYVDLLECPLLSPIQYQR